MAKIIAGSNGHQLAKYFSQTLKIEYTDAHINRFADQELRIEIPMDLGGQEVIIVQSTSQPANDHLMELLLLIDAAKNAGAKRVIAVVPYFGYSRQDHLSYQGAPISAKLVARLLETAGVDCLITLDLHAKQVENFFTITVHNVDTVALFASNLEERKNLVIISPDIGGIERAQLLSHHLGVSFALINKSRQRYNICHMNQVLGNISNKNCIIIDDIVDTGGTLCKAADLLIQQGALRVEAVVTHGVLSGDAVDNIMASGLSNIAITNSITHPRLPDHFVVVDVAPLLENKLKWVLDSITKN